MRQTIFPFRDSIISKAVLLNCTAGPSRMILASFNESTSTKTASDIFTLGLSSPTPIPFRQRANLVAPPILSRYDILSTQSQLSSNAPHQGSEYSLRREGSNRIQPVANRITSSGTRTGIVNFVASVNKKTFNVWYANQATNIPRQVSLMPTKLLRP